MHSRGRCVESKIAGISIAILPIEASGGNRLAQQSRPAS
jgi:hypothetical protein